MTKTNLGSLKIALAGNPNCGKTSLFNRLSGLKQKVGNFPGVTVDVLASDIKLHNREIALIDLPGTYSMFPNSEEEKIVVETLLNQEHEHHPELVVFVADSLQLEKQLVLFSQIADLGMPTLLVLNMQDQARRKGVEWDLAKLKKDLGVDVLTISARTGEGIDELKQYLAAFDSGKIGPAPQAFYQLNTAEKEGLAALKNIYSEKGPHAKLALLYHGDWLTYIGETEKNLIIQAREKADFSLYRQQIIEQTSRLHALTELVKPAKTLRKKGAARLTEKIDRIVTHKLLGPFIFFAIMLVTFQAIFTWASYPMGWIEDLFAWAGGAVGSTLGDTWYAGLIADGLIAGLGGVLVFIPQIAVLFFVIGLLEETGYMSRAVYLFDSLMQRFGLNGRSIVSLISGGACAVPAIMATRTISNWKERLITIMVTPFISCSARIPVYTILVAFVIGPGYFGPFRKQALVFFGLYILGIVGALGAALVFRMVLKSKTTTYLALELPAYKVPVFRNVWLDMLSKVKTFTWEAGKIILAISVILWFLASYGPTADMEAATERAAATAQEQGLDLQAQQDLEASLQLEASYAGIMGKSIEPAIAPLGYDWKIGIALITSFAAREVFIGTMATIYSVGDSNDDGKLRDRMRAEVHHKSGEKVYTAGTSLSLLIFYVFAMQCMSTLAVVRRETKSWKWPIIQFVYMTAVAYFGAWLVYVLL